MIPAVTCGVSLSLAFPFLVPVPWWCGTARCRSARFCGWATEQSLPYLFVFPLLLLSFALSLCFLFLRSQFRLFSLFFFVRIGLVIPCLRWSRCDLRLAAQDLHGRFEFGLERYGGAGFEKVECLWGFTRPSVLDTRLL